MKFKTNPMEHQLRYHNNHRNKRYFGLLWDQGTGKTKAMLDDMAYQHQQGYIDCAVVIAPSGVHANWHEEEIPLHLATDHVSFVYYNGMGKKWEQEFVDFIDRKNHRDKLKIICFPTEGFSMAKKQKIALEYILKHHKCMGVIDESDDIGTYNAKRTKYLLNLSKQFVSRRIATGTPADRNPLQFWSQLTFLSPSILKQDFFSFRSRYSVMKEKVVYVNGRERIQKFPVGYRNLDKLKEIVEQHTDRVMKSDCLDLPERTYVTIPLELSGTQKRLYNDMLERAFYLLEEQDDVVYAKNALDMVGKLARVSGGFADKGVPIEPSVKLQWVVNNIHRYTADKDVIIWCRFRDEIEAVAHSLGDQAIVIHGGITGEDRMKAAERFKTDPNIKVLVTNKTMSRGHTLVNATTNIYFSNSFSLRDRRQSEERIYRKGQTDKCINIDLVCRGTVDELVLESLKQKKNVSDYLLGDEAKAWIQKL